MPKLFKLPRPRFSIRLNVVTIVLTTTLITAAVAIGLQYYFSRNLALESAVADYQQAARNTSEFIDAMDQRATQVTRLLSLYPMLATATLAEQPQIRALFAEAMRTNPIFSSIYLGFANGDFFEVANLADNPYLRQGYKASAEDSWVLDTVSVQGEQRVRQLYYYDQQFQLRATATEASNYDVRERRWFKDARADRVTKSAPYMFQYMQVAGQTYSIKLPASETVLGVDFTLQAFSEYLHQQPLSTQGDIYIYQASGEVLASNRLSTDQDSLLRVPSLPLSAEQRAYLKGLGTLKVANQMNWPPIDFAVAGQPKGYSIDLLRMLAAMLDIRVEFINGFSRAEFIDQLAANQIQIMQPVIASDQQQALGLLSEPLVNLPYGLALRESDAGVKRLDELRGKLIAVPRDWAMIDHIKTHYPELRLMEAASTKQALTWLQDGKVFGALNAAAVLHYTAQQYFMTGLRFYDRINFAAKPLPTDYRLLLSREHQPLLELFNLALAHLGEPQKLALAQKWLARTGRDSLAIVPYKALIEQAAALKGTGQMERLTRKGKEYFSYVSPLDQRGELTSYFALVVPVDEVLAPSMRKVRLSIALTIGCLLLLLPVSWLFAEPIVRPIRQLHHKSILVKERRYGDIRHVSSHIKEIDELSQSMMDMAESIKAHEQGQRDLMESFIQLIAEAIDAKSPYTGGHCARVPELALMLVDAAEKSTLPAFAEFRFANEDEYREFKTAAWLHDCGKIIVPEHIVDKGTKLETIYNRIHEVRTRFEILWRDAQILYLQDTLAQPAQEPQLQQQLHARQAQLQADFEFVARTNIGGEFLSDTHKERLQSIAQTPWQRHFDDRLGLSPVELQRVQGAAPSLPVTEQLLSDKPEHIIARERAAEYPPQLGINMDIPTHLYNLGEVYNLSIARGTLTAEDRFKINEHMINTIRMLERLPFPKELARVPRYASTHHETMKGTGYPRKLKGEALSIPERILAVADIFEALTAADRPYKEAKTVSASLDILHKMMLDEHVDRAVFELFVRSGVYQEYAERYLTPAQRDQVDVSKYLS